METSQNVSKIRRLSEEECDDGDKEEEEQKSCPCSPLVLLSATQSPMFHFSDSDAELLELAGPELTNARDIIKVELQLDKAEAVHFEEDKDSHLLEEEHYEVPQFDERIDVSDSLPNSVACQTEWSWLAAFRAIQDKLPKKSTSANRMSESKSQKVSTLNGSESMTSSATTDNIEEFRPTLESLKSEPWPSRADEYGIPIQNSSEDEEEDKESDAHPFEEQKENDKPTDQDEEENEEEDDKEEGEDVEENVVSSEKLFSGTCGFCGKPKKPIPSPEEQATKAPEEEPFCCSAFRDYANHVTATAGKKKFKKMKNETLEEFPSGQRKRKKNRKLEAIKAEERPRSGTSSASTELSGRTKDEGKRGFTGESGKMEEVEHRKSFSSRPGSRNSVSGHKAEKADQHCIVSDRLMTKINYQLSSSQCLSWTLGLDDDFCFEPHQVVEPVQHQGGRSHPGSTSGILSQTYDTGSPFLIIFSDGSGNVFYPGGQIAVTIISSVKDVFMYVVHHANGRLLGLYEPNGRTVTYYENGSLWVRTDETGGVEMDTEGNQRKRWSWNERKKHVHAPPLFSITCSMSKALTLSISSQYKMMLLFQSSRRACRFNVGAHPGVILKKRYNRIMNILEGNEIYMKNIKSRINVILQKTSALLKLPGCPRMEVKVIPASPVKRKSNSSSLQKDTLVLPAIID